MSSDVWQSPGSGVVNGCDLTRERAVFAQVVEGRLNKQIAGTLGTCERTVKAHRAHVMEKMQAHSVAELVHHAVHLELEMDMDAGPSTTPPAAAMA